METAHQEQTPRGCWNCQIYSNSNPGCRLLFRGRLHKLKQFCCHCFWKFLHLLILNWTKIRQERCIQCGVKDWVFLMSSWQYQDQLLPPRIWHIELNLDCRYGNPLYKREKVHFVFNFILQWLQGNPFCFSGNLQKSLLFHIKSDCLLWEFQVSKDSQLN